MNTDTAKSEPLTLNTDNESCSLLKQLEGIKKEQETISVGFFDNIEVSDDAPKEEVLEEDKPKDHYDTSIKPEYHEIANREPMMTQLEMGGLVELMKKGFDKDQPIYMYQGKVLDGRNRTVAAKAAGVKVVTKTFTGTYEEAEAKSVMLNNRRRHKSAGQKAMAAAYAIKAYDERREVFEKNLLVKNPSISKRELVRQKGKYYPKLSIKTFAEQQGSSSKSARNATNLLDNDKDLATQVFAGKLSLTKAQELYQEILTIRQTKTKASDGDYTPEELERFDRIKQAKQDPEGTVAKLELAEIQLEQLQTEKKQSMQTINDAEEYIKSIESELDDFKQMYTEYRLSENVDDTECEKEDK